MLRLFIINRTIINRGCWEQGSKEEAEGISYGASKTY